MINKIKDIFYNQLYTISLYFRQFAGTVVLLLIVRFLSVYDYGLFASYNNIIGFLFMFANLGYSEYILVSSQKNVKNVQLKIGLFTICAFYLALFYFIIFQFVNLESKLLFSIIILNTFLNSTFFGLVLPYFQADDKFKIISYVNIFYSVMQIFIASVCYIYKLNLFHFLIMETILGLINFIQCSYYAKINYVSVLKNFKNFLSKIDKSILIYAGSSLVFWFYNRIPSLYVSTCIEKEQAALFFSAYNIAGIIMVLMGAQYQKMIPEMIKVPVFEIRQIIKKNLIFMLSVDFLFLLIFLLLGKSLILLVYSKEYYVNALPYVILLTLGNIAITFASVYGAYMTANGYQKIKLLTMASASFITILSIIICHNLGLYAAVIAYILSAGFMGITYYILGIILLKKQERGETIGE